MPLLNFQKQFTDDVRSGKKTQTIRKQRKYPIKEGDTLYLYSGLRTKYTEKLGKGFCCGIATIEIYEECLITWESSGYLGEYMDDIDEFARQDGFKDWDSLVEWFKKTHRLPFKGILIKWFK